MSVHTPRGEGWGWGAAGGSPSSEDNTTAQNLPNELPVSGRGWLVPTIFSPLLVF